jgi:hypothetical protein
LLGFAVVGSIVTVAMLTVPLYRGLVVRQSLERAADASALGAADVASGLSAGTPCATASSVASANGVSLAGCAADGLVVTVVVHATFLGLSLAASATAGPSDSVTN